MRTTDDGRYVPETDADRALLDALLDALGIWHAHEDGESRSRFSRVEGDGWQADGTYACHFSAEPEQVDFLRLLDELRVWPARLSVYHLTHPERVRVAWEVEGLPAAVGRGPQSNEFPYRPMVPAPRSAR